MAHGTGFLDDYLPYLLRRADQTLSAAFYATLTECGVARSEWRVLAVLEELGVALHELRSKVGSQPEQVVANQDLSIAVGAGADADGWDVDGLRDARGEVGGNPFEDQRVRASLRDGPDVPSGSCLAIRATCSR